MKANETKMDRANAEREMVALIEKGQHTAAWTIAQSWGLTDRYFCLTKQTPNLGYNAWC